MSKNSDSKKVKQNFMDSNFLKIVKKPLTIVEMKNIEDIKSILKTDKKLTSSELSQMMGLSRTRCNEYFKIMEKMNMVEPVLRRRKKYYRLKE